VEFGLADQQRDLVDAAREYSATHLGPRYRQRDREGALDAATIAEMGKLGFFGIEFPERLGGLGLDLPHTAEAAMCKWWGPKLAYDIVGSCLLTHGHEAYSTTDLPFEQRLRDLLGLQIGDGTAQIMKLVIARQKAAQHG
jgi:alkylation response protein AidB-like acyl-CoA dehydrogenase